MAVKGECDAIGILIKIKVPPNTLGLLSKWGWHLELPSLKAM